MLRTTMLLALLAAAADAQTLTVTQADRSLYAQAFGYDYEFNDGISDSASNTALSGEWIDAVDADLDDYYGIPVGRGQAYQESQIDPSSLSFTLDVQAEAYGNLFQSDSLGRGDYEVTFTTTEKVRYAAVAHADTSYGYNTSSVRLSGAGGTVFQVNGDYGGWVTLTQAGWIDAGSYTLDGEAEVQSYAPSGSPDAQSGNAECDFKLFHAADYDLDGDVDYADKSSFKADYLAGEEAADFDGDGDTDLSDWRRFKKAWKNG